MEDELLATIKTNKVLASLDEPAHLLLLPKFTKLELSPNEILFSQGDPSDQLFLLAKGKLVTSLITPTGLTRIVGHIDAGEAVGETGVLTNEPRALTIKALTPCTLYSLPSNDFLEICHQYPSVMLAAIHPIMMRSRELIQSLVSEKTNKHIVIAPAHKDISLEKFFEKLAGFIEKYPRILFISDYHADFNQPYIDTAALNEKILSREKGKKKLYKIIYFLKSSTSPLANIAFKKMDSLYITAYSNAVPAIDPILLEKLEQHKGRHKVDPVMVLLHTESAVMPRNTSLWLSKASFVMHHHVRIHITKDYLRLLRYIREKAVGIVLGGGGTRGWAHLGALRAIREQKIPIDMIGGTSVGAIVGACYAIHESYDDAYDRFSKIAFESSHSISWRNITWPAISLFDAKNFTQSQMDAFHQIKIEDLWLPYFCISCNLATNNEDIHRHGVLWEKTRASSSIPGLIPPMLINQELHMDGGLLNNLPVDVMRSLLGNKSKIIAVELNSFSADPHKYQFPPILTFRQALLAKLGFTREHYVFPRFVDTFLRAIFIGSRARTMQNSLAANILINLNLNKFRMLQSNTKQAKKLLDIGYETALKQLQKIKSTD